MLSEDGGGVAMDAAEFIAALRASGANGFRRFEGPGQSRTKIAGEIDFSGISFEKSLIIKNAHFQDAVNLNNREFAGRVVFESCEFDQPVNLDKTAFKNGLRIIDCRFGVAGGDLASSRILLDDARVRGDLIFDRVTVHGCISARRLQLAGNLEFTACTVDGESSSESTTLDLSTGKIKGSVIFETGRPTAAATAAAIENDTPAARRPHLRRSFFRNRRGGGSSVMLRGAEVTDLVRLAWARFEGELDLSFIKCRGLSSEAQIYRCRKDERAGGRTDRGSVAARETFGGVTIEGPITLSGGKFGLIHLHGIFVTGAIILIAGRSGQINIDDSICDGDDGERFVATSQIGNFIMSRWRCRDFLYLHAAKITGATNQLRVRGVVIKSSVIDRGVSFWPGWILQLDSQGYLEREPDQNSRPSYFAIRPNGSLVNVKSDQDYRDLFNRWRRRLAVCGNIIIDHCSIGDDVILTGVDLAAESEAADGRVEITDSKVDGNVLFRSPISFLANAQIEAPLLWFLAQRLVVGDQPQSPQQRQTQAGPPARNHNLSFAPACCHALDMRGLQADEIDLTGLCIEQPSTGSAKAAVGARRSSNPASATMSHLKVYGKVATFARISMKEAVKIFGAVKESALDQSSGLTEEADPKRMKQRKRERQVLSLCFGDQANSIYEPKKRLEANAKIRDALDLQHSEIGELLISDASFFEHSPEKRAAESGIVLDYAQISKLYVARMHDPKSREHNGFPVPVSLLDLSVRTWFLEEEGVPGTVLKEEGVPGTVMNYAYIVEQTTAADPYLDLLENDPAFRMSSYLAIEKSLRDRGLTDEARQIFIAGYYRDVRAKSKERPVNNNKDQAVKNKAKDHLSWLRARYSKLRGKPWRRGEGRFRQSMLAEFFGSQDGKRDPLVVGLFAIGCAAAVFAAAGIISKLSPVSFTWLLPITFYFLALHGKFFRLERPSPEYFGFVFSTIWCAATFYVGVRGLIGGAQSRFFFLSILFFLLLLLCAVPVRGALRRFVDQLYWSLVDYGTSALRLAGIIFILMFISFAFVSGERVNFEPTLLAELEAQRADVSADPTKPTWDTNRVPKSQSWGIGERLWMTLRHHVPLVGAIVSEEWQPAHRPLTIAGMGKPSAGRASPDWWLLGDRYWPRARDWYAIMLWMNWILWPLFLPFLIHRLSRER